MNTVRNMRMVTLVLFAHIGLAQVINIERSTNSLRLTWPAEQGKEYWVLSKTNLTGAWDNMSDSVKAVVSSANAETYVEPTAGSGFFTLLVAPPQGEGNLLVLSNQTLSGTVSLFAVGAPLDGNEMTVFELDEITDGVTNTLMSVPAEGTNGTSFALDTRFMPNGVHLIQARMQDSSTNDLGALAYEFTSVPVPVNVSNAIFYPSDDELTTGWMLTVRFASVVKEGTWTAQVFDDTGALWGMAQGDMSQTNENGFIEIADSTVDDGAGGTRFRNFNDQYDTSFFDVYISVSGSGSATGALSRAVGKHGPPNYDLHDYIKKRVGHRPDRRLSLVGLDPSVIASPEDSIDKELLYGTAEIALSSFSLLAQHFNLNDMAAEDTVPGSQLWNRLDSSNQWVRLNYAIAARYSSFNTSPKRLTHMFTVTHGNEYGIAAKNGGVLYGSVTIPVLKQLGFRQTNGLTYVFLDGCDSAAGGLIPFLLLDAGEGNNITLAELIRSGKFPYYGAGWTKPKYVGFMNKVVAGHVEYVQVYFTSLFELDPILHLPANTYEQARARAMYLKDNPNAINLYSGHWKDFGCRELYVDE